MNCSQRITSRTHHGHSPKRPKSYLYRLAKLRRRQAAKRGPLARRRRLQFSAQNTNNPLRPLLTRRATLLS